MKATYIYDAAHTRALPAFTREPGWFSLPLAEKIARLTAHAEAHREDIPTRREIERLASMPQPWTEKMRQQLGHDTRQFMTALQQAFWTGDQVTLGELARQKGSLAQRHKASGNESRFDFDDAFGKLWENALPVILTHAAEMRGHREIEITDRRSENGLRDFTFRSDLGQFDLDAKATAGASVVLELATLAHPQGWFHRMPDGHWLASSRLGDRGLGALLLPVNTLRREDQRGRAWWTKHGRSATNYKKDKLWLVDPCDLKGLPSVVNLTPAWQQCAQSGLLVPESP